MAKGKREIGNTDSTYSVTAISTGFLLKSGFAAQSYVSKETFNNIIWKGVEKIEPGLHDIVASFNIEVMNESDLSFPKGIYTTIDKFTRYVIKKEELPAEWILFVDDGPSSDVESIFDEIVRNQYIRQHREDSTLLDWSLYLEKTIGEYLSELPALGSEKKNLSYKDIFSVLTGERESAPSTLLYGLVRLAKDLEGENENSGLIEFSKEDTVTPDVAIPKFPRIIRRYSKEKIPAVTTYDIADKIYARNGFLSENGFVTFLNNLLEYRGLKNGTLKSLDDLKSVDSQKIRAETEKLLEEVKENDGLPIHYLSLSPEITMEGFDRLAKYLNSSLVKRSGSYNNGDQSKKYESLVWSSKKERNKYLLENGIITDEMLDEQREKLETDGGVDLSGISSFDLLTVILNRQTIPKEIFLPVYNRAEKLQVSTK